MAHKGVQETLGQAAQCLNQGNAAGAKALLAQLPGQVKAHPSVLYLQGAVAKLEGDLPSAEALYRQSLARNSRQPQVANALGAVLRSQRRYTEAMAAFATAADLEPRYLDARFNLGLAALDAGRTEQAIAAFQAVLDREASHLRAQSGLGQAYQAAGRHTEALDLFTRVTARAPDNWRALAGAAASHLALDDLAAASTSIDAAERIETRSAELAKLRGRIAFAGGRHDDAVAAFDRATALAPTDPDAHRHLNQLLYMLGDDARFLRSYREALGAHPRDPGLLCGLANFALHTDNPAVAVDVLGKAVADGVGDAAVLDALGLVHGALSGPEAGLEWHRKAVERAPNEKVIRQNYGAALLGTAAFLDAKMQIEQALKIDPRDRMTLAYYVTVLQCLGDPQADRLFDPARFIDAREIPVPEGYASLEAFNAALAHDLTALHQMTAEPFDQSLRGGTQVELSRLAKPPKTVSLLKQALLQNVESFMAGLPHEAGHPFLGWPEGPVRFSGLWSVSLRKGGHHVGHAHPEGWISSCYYVSLPREVAGDPDKRGWIYFGTPPVPGLEDRITAHHVEPRAGTLVLFPSYLWHGTVPFDSDDRRLTVAFDAVPAGVS